MICFTRWQLNTVTFFFGEKLVSFVFGAKKESSNNYQIISGFFLLLIVWIGIIRQFDPEKVLLHQILLPISQRRR